jgi:hypothetical protein
MEIYGIICGECNKEGFTRIDNKDVCKNCGHELTDEEHQSILKQAYKKFNEMREYRVLKESRMESELKLGKVYKEAEVDSMCIHDCDRFDFNCSEKDIDCIDCLVKHGVVEEVRRIKEGSKLKLKLSLEELEKHYREEYTSSEEQYISNDLNDERTQMVCIFDDVAFNDLWKEAKPFFEKGDFVVHRTYNHGLAYELVGFGWGVEASWFEEEVSNE